MRVGILFLRVSATCFSCSNKHNKKKEKPGNEATERPHLAAL